jgi:pilus assembly protein CpaB
VAAGKLLVAAHELQVGSLVTESDIRAIAWNNAIPEQAIKDPREIIGRGVIATIYPNEPILNARLAPKGAGAGLAATIPVGKRAVALKVDEVVGLAGFVLPGMRVDVIVCGTDGVHVDERNSVTRTILQNLEVLSAGQRIERSTDGKPENVQVVNLLVSPDQAEALSLASTQMKVQLVLRNPLDTEQQVTHGTSIAQLFGTTVEKPAAPARPRPAPVAAPKPEEKPLMVEIFHGAKRTEEPVDRSGGVQ